MAEAKPLPTPAELLPRMREELVGVLDALTADGILTPEWERDLRQLCALCRSVEMVTRIQEALLQQSRYDIERDFVRRVEARAAKSSLKNVTLLMIAELNAKER